MAGKIRFVHNKKLCYILFTAGILLGRLAHAQDTLILKGVWKIQPASTPAEPPKVTEWGSTLAPDQQKDWRNDLQCGRNTAWAAMPHDSINSLWFEKTISVPRNWKDKRVLVDFRRIEGDAIIYLNGNRVSELLRPGGEVDLTREIRFGEENALQVFVTRNYTGISRNFLADPLRYLSRQAGSTKIAMKNWGLGISAPVQLMARNTQAITDVFCISSYRNKSLTLQVEVDAAQGLSSGYLEAIVQDATGKSVLQLKSGPLKIAAGKMVYNLSALWANPIYWELEKPYLYRVMVRLISDKRDESNYPPFNFGFREIWTAGKEMYMNGHLSRWRLTDLYGANKNGLSFYRLMGYNVGQIQPHHNLWWRASAETPLLDEDLLNEMDRIGMGCTVPAPGVTHLRTALLTNKLLLSAYQKEMAYYLRRYRNHPSILAWVVGLNSYNPKSNIAAQTMGKRDTAVRGQGKVIALACQVVKQFDQSRLAYSHADGSIGDISTANVYLNFVPLQEREDWPMEWAAHGNMPYSAVEFGPPYWNNFWKGNQFLLTEYLALYSGDDAYRTETSGALKNVTKLSLVPKNTTWEQLDFNQYPEFWSFQRLFTTNTNRSWRSWGVNAGWLYWLLEGYGNPPEHSAHFTQRYKLEEPVNNRPTWVNPRFDIFKVGNQPLLAYLGGYPVHTDKTHSYYSGEMIRKQVAVVWDAPEPLTAMAFWSLNIRGKTVSKGTVPLLIKGGEIRQIPFSLLAPAVRLKTEYQLILSVQQDKFVITKDTLAISVFPKLASVTNMAGIAIYDPLRKSAGWLNQLGITTKTWKKGSSLKGIHTFVIGREALQPGDRLPYTEADLAGGLQVIILEQQPAVWEGMGFHTIEAMSRYAFIRDSSSAVLKGLSNTDMRNWRGTPDLLPEGKLAREYDEQHAPKWTNRHAVASVALQTPELVGFRPLLQTEFDLAYSPLLEFAYGKGKITFCSLDLSGRVGSDPAATLLAHNLINASALASAAQHAVNYSGDTTGRIRLRRLGISFRTQTALDPQTLLIIGANSPLSPKQVQAFVASGGTVFYLPQNQEYLTKLGFKTQNKAFFKCSPVGNKGMLKGIGPNLLRWRDTLNLAAFTADGQPAGAQILADGLLLQQHIGSGQQYFLQAGPELLSTRYNDATAKKEAIQLSVIRLQQLQVALLTNLGVQPMSAVAQRLNVVTSPSAYQTLGTWKVLGPYPVAGLDGAKLLASALPGQQDAIDGGENPNLTYKRSDGVMLDWRSTVQADPNGFVDLSKAFKGLDENAVAFVTRSISSGKAQHATLRLGVDYWMEAWLNGKSVLQVSQSHSKRENEFILDLPFKSGENILTLKIGSGRGGFGFWSNISYEKALQKESIHPEAATVNFYQPLFKKFDPYQFVYW